MIDAFVPNEFSCADTGELFVKAFHLNPIGMVVSQTADARIVEVNSAFCELLGYSREELIGKTSIELNLWADVADRQALYEIFRRDGLVCNQEAQLRTRCGGFLSLLASIHPARIGGVDCLVSSVMDIGERKRQDATLRHALAEGERQRTEMKQILDNLPDAYYRTDAAGKVLFCTQSAQDIFGFSAEQLIGRQIADLYVVPEEREKVLQTILAAAGQFVLVEARMKRADGSSTWASTKARALFDAEGRFVGVEGAGRNISGRIYMEQALRESLRQLQNKESAKTRFLAAASHDLRQPIQAITLFLDALKRSTLDAKQEKLALQLGAAVQSLGDLLNALLDISRLDAGIVQPQRQAIGVQDLFAEIEPEISPQALARNLRFKLWFPLAHLTAYADKSLLKAILRNLVVNALSNTQRGGLLLSARPRGDEVLLQVWDTGVGIGPEHLEKIFEEFYQIHNPERDRNKGLGLGLAIVRRTAALMGAAVCCRSRLGRGTVFEFRLPVFDPVRHGKGPAPTRAPDEVTDLRRIKGKRFVVVEDDEQLARSLEVWLQNIGAEVQRYADAESALSLCSVEEIDYFITDFRLPGMLDGIVFLNEVRRMLSRPVPAVLITGDTSAAFIAQASVSGWPVLFKPVPPDAILQALLAAQRS